MKIKNKYWRENGLKNGFLFVIVFLPLHNCILSVGLSHEIPIKWIKLCECKMLLEGTEKWLPFLSDARGRAEPAGWVRPSRSDFCRLAIRDLQLTSCKCIILVSQGHKNMNGTAKPVCNHFRGFLPLHLPSSVWLLSLLPHSFLFLCCLSSWF